MSIPISGLPILFLIYSIFWLVFSFFNVFHAAKFGLADKTNKITLAAYILISGFLLLSSLLFIADTDWSAAIVLNNAI